MTNCLTTRSSLQTPLTLALWVKFHAHLQEQVCCSPTPPLLAEQPRPTFPIYVAPLTKGYIAEKRKNIVPERQKDIQYHVSVWEAWCKHQLENISCHIPPLTSITLAKRSAILVGEVHSWGTEVEWRRISSKYSKTSASLH